ncbi:MAG: TIGR01777 family protein [Actinobacteria bacterium]|nr:TIGR01777 family protein [Actinomycetota bacterium]
MLDAFNGGSDGRGTVGQDIDLKICRECFAKLRHHGLNAIDHLDDVGSGLTLDVEQNARSRIAPGCLPDILDVVDHVRNFGKFDWSIISISDDKLAELLGARPGDSIDVEVLESRTRGTDLLARTLASLDAPPPVLVSGSAIGIYGDTGDTAVDESGPHARDFLAEVCVHWEAATAPAAEAGIRVAHLRTGIVLTPEGGALAKLLPLFKLGAGGRMGSGRQWWSWISLADEISVIRWLLDTEVSGPVNATAPNPVTNAEMTRILGSVLHRPTLLPVPSFGPKLLLGSELAQALLFTSQRVEPAVLTGQGFTFAHPTLESALRSMLGRPAAA